jgi:predicted nucleic acid-binding protein
VADAVLLDDWTARLEAQRRHLTVLGTLRVLADAAEKGFADLRLALDRLQQTNFRARPELIEALLKWDAQRKHK